VFSEYDVIGDDKAVYSRLVSGLRKIEYPAPTWHAIL
jgi:hypothetical protein